MHLVRPATSLAPNLSGGGGSSVAAMGLHSAVPPTPMPMWRWFADCLSSGDGQPLQKLAIGALSRLLSSADLEAMGAGEVSEMLRSRVFLRPFFRALAYNHKKQATEGGDSAGAEQWSLGVKEILQDAGRGDRELVSSAVVLLSCPVCKRVNEC